MYLVGRGVITTVRGLGSIPATDKKSLVFILTRFLRKAMVNQRVVSLPNGISLLGRSESVLYFKSDIRVRESIKHTRHGHMQRGENLLMSRTITII